MSGNYRLGEFAGAILNCQLDRLDEQTDTRDANGRYLDTLLARIPGITPQRRDADATRNAYHLYPFRYDERTFGLSRARFHEALAAEGIPSSTGYVLPLYRQPLFADRAFGPYTGYRAARPDIDYGAMRLPVCDRICGGEGSWLTQNLLLGPRSDMDDIARAIEKIYADREALAGAPPAAVAGAAT
jgi:dTDP-4-amino-4,6-dideoxygalactose transaminase